MKGLNILTAAIFSAASILSSPSVLAAVAAPYGWYVEGNLGKSQADNKTYGNNTTVNGKGTGWNVNLGYKFITYFAAEIGYTNYAKSVVKSGVNVAQDTHYAMDLVGKGILPIGDFGFDLFAKLGMAYAHSNTSITNASAASGLGINTGTNTSTGLYYGVGAEYYLIPNAAVNIQANRTKGSNGVGYLNLVSVGVSWLFS